MTFLLREKDQLDSARPMRVRGANAEHAWRRCPSRRPSKERAAWNNDRTCVSKRCMPSSRVDSYFAVAGAVGLAMSLLVSVWSLHALDSRAATSPAAFDPALIRKGAELAALGNCVVCHTATDGKPY